MTVAVLLGAEGSRRNDQLAAQLAAVGAAEVRRGRDDLVGDLRAIVSAALAGQGPLLLCTDDLVAHTGALWMLATEPGGGSVALVGPGAPTAPGYARVREERGQVVEAGVPGPVGGTGHLLGALRVAAEDRAALTAAAERLALDLLTGPLRADAPSAVDLLVAELVGGGTRVAACRVRPLVAERVTDPAGARAAEARVAAVDEDRALLRLAVKERDDFFSTYFVSSYSPRLVRWAARRGLSPTAVTGISVVLAVVAAAGFATGDRAAQVAAGVLLYASFVLDCVDGQLARYRRQFSPFGGWLDAMADRAKEYLVYAGLALGAVHTGHPEGWWLAIAAMILQTVRHVSDTWYGALHDEAARRRGPEAEGGRLGAVSVAVQARPGTVAYWLKRIVVFPIGERWALIALTGAVLGPWAALVAVLGWGSLAALYTLVLRALRARAMRVAVLADAPTAGHRDDGALAAHLARRAPAGRLRPLPAAVSAMVAAAAALVAQVAGLVGGRAWLALPVGGVLLAAATAGRPHDGALDWLVPAALRAAEYLTMIAVGVACDVPPPLLFALILALALAQYDRVARREKRAALVARRAADLGYEGRVLIAVAGAGLPLAATGAVLSGLTGYVLVVLGIGVYASWGRPASSGGPAGVPGR